MELIHCLQTGNCHSWVFSKLDIGHLCWENGGVRFLPFLLLDKNQSASLTPNSVFLSSLKGQMHHHDDLGSKCDYTCHLSNKTTRKSVLLSTPQIWLWKWVKNKPEYGHGGWSSADKDKALKMTFSLSADNPNMNLPCQICVVKEDKEPLQSLPATDSSRPIRRGA